MDGLVDEWTDGYINGWSSSVSPEIEDGWMNGWTDGRMAGAILSLLR
jgi:hypothetical protein